jgi:hypothetical protein
VGKKKSDIYKRFSDMRAALKGAFSTVKEELDDHREAINENSNEIGANYELLMKLDAKMDKLSERLDDMQLMIENQSGREVKRPTIELTKTEQKVFLMLYTASDALSCSELSDRSGIREDIVSEVIEGLIGKGISIVHEFRKRLALVRLDKDFKENHAKRNLVRIDGSVLLDGIGAVPVAD